jgi:hypothetical protein
MTGAIWTVAGDDRPSRWLSYDGHTWTADPLTTSGLADLTTGTVVCYGPPGGRYTLTDLDDPATLLVAATVVIGTPVTVTGNAPNWPEMDNPVPGDLIEPDDVADRAPQAAAPAQAQAAAKIARRAPQSAIKTTSQGDPQQEGEEDG